MKTITKTIMYLQMTALCLTAALAGPAAADKEVPFKGSIQAVETHVVQFPTLFVDASGSGNATHLGRFTVTYEFEVDLLTLAGIGSAHFIAANGDSLFTEVTGQGTPTETPTSSLLWKRTPLRAARVGSLARPGASPWSACLTLLRASPPVRSTGPS